MVDLCRRTSRHWGSRTGQWQAAGSTNALLTKYYQNALMGDSPEMMPLDNSLFNDLIKAIGKHVCATWNEKGEGKYSMGTPDEAWSTMMRVWKLCRHLERAHHRGH